MRLFDPMGKRCLIDLDVNTAGEDGVRRSRRGAI